MKNSLLIIFLINSPLLFAERIAPKICIGVSVEANKINVNCSGSKNSYQLAFLSRILPKQPFYQQSINGIHHVVVGKEIVVHPVDDNRAVIFIKGQNVNIKILRSGWAWVDRKQTSNRGYHRASTQARESKRGLFSFEEQVHPDNFKQAENYYKKIKTAMSDKSIGNRVMLSLVGNKQTKIAYPTVCVLEVRAIPYRDRKIYTQQRSAEAKGYNLGKLCNGRSMKLALIELCSVIPQDEKTSILQYPEFCVDYRMHPENRWK